MKTRPMLFLLSLGCLSLGACGDDDKSENESQGNGDRGGSNRSDASTAERDGSGPPSFGKDGGGQASGDEDGGTDEVASRAGRGGSASVMGGTGGGSSGGMGGAGGDATTRHVSGTVRGHAVDIASEASFATSQASPKRAIGNAFLSNVADLCEALVDSRKTGSDHANGRAIVLVFGENDADALAAGSYSVNYDYTDAKPPSTGRFAAASFNATDAKCESPMPRLDATEGTIELTKVDTTVIAGTFELTFDNGDKLTGSFTAPRCDQFLTTSREDAGPGACID